MGEVSADWVVPEARVLHPKPSANPNLRPPSEAAILALQRVAGNRAVTSIRTLTAQRETPSVNPLGASPAPVSGSVAVYWLPNRTTRETFVVLHSESTLPALASYLYGTAGVAEDLATINGVEASSTLSPGTRLKVAPLKGHKATPKAASSFRESPWFAPTTQDPAARMAAMGVSHPSQFAAVRRARDQEVERDFRVIVEKLNESHYSDADEGVVLDLLRRWGREQLTRKPSQYSEGSEYLDRLLRMLRGKTKDVGIVTEQWTNYYSLMFNHFDRVDELRQIRDTYSRDFRAERGSRELSFGGFFWDEVKSGAIRDQIFAYGKGVGKGIESGIKGTVEFAHTLFTNPNKAWQQMKAVPGAVKKLWENRSALWKKFVNASPEEQAELIGKLVGEVELAIASGGVAGAAGRAGASLGSRLLLRLAQSSGRLSKLASFVIAAVGATSRIVGRFGQMLAYVRALSLAAVRSMWSPLRAVIRVAKTRLRALGSRVRGGFDKKGKKRQTHSEDPSGSTDQTRGRTTGESVEPIGVSKPVPGPETLTADELAELQAIANRHKVELHVIGSRAKGTARNIDRPELPTGKGGTARSDIDIRYDGQADIDSGGQLSHALREVSNNAGEPRAAVRLTGEPPVIIIRPQ